MRRQVAAYGHRLKDGYRRISQSCSQERRISCRGYAGSWQPIFRVSQNPIDHETLHKQDFRGRAHFDASRHPDPIADARLFHRDVRATQHARQEYSHRLGRGAVDYLFANQLEVEGLGHFLEEGRVLLLLFAESRGPLLLFHASTYRAYPSVPSALRPKEAARCIVERFYNRCRLPSALAYQSPEE